MTALLHGPSGTGKTLAAEVLAGALGLDLWSVDLSALVSKYIGETEKNLRAAFEAAEASGAVLLFDEADALFGRRSEVKDSHDRYANQQASYLLQRMESFRGLAVLTTNFREAIDNAFLRRLRFVIGFPHPGPAERERLWRGAFPPAAPVGALDFARLAQANLAGGHIRNIALAAAFLAAEDGTPIGMAHLLRAARRECAKLERPLTPAEVAGWL
ncbi:ATP-binding protein [Roseomonas pecuniae]|uniref:ATP-binding protein n=1 Tax=Roseomonas populi TaxID=3121582 RepID=A0ABT1X3V1_9PROT|nr:ATP-binding protein [Roseomonas pecuniae]